MPFRQLGDYKIGKTIGAGAFSKVKVATHIPSKQKVFKIYKVAIKILDKQMMKNVSEKAQAVKQEREKRQMIAQQKKAYYDSLRQKRIEQDNEESDDSEDDGKPIKFNELIQEMMKRKEEIEKVELPAKTAQPETTMKFLSTFQKETLLLMRLDHPNIIKIFEIIETETECYIVMYHMLTRELATGGELMDYVTSNGRLNEKDARKFFRQIVSGLSHIHDSNVVHRDLKLENILLDKNRNVLISDFGLGRTFDPESTDDMMTFCGTPNYAAVELIMGQPYNGVKSDIWSLGVILYILATGQRPFAGPTVGILYKRIMGLDYEKPKYLSEELLDIFARIFVKDPKKRIDMDAIRNHPWVCAEEGPIVLYHPKMLWNVDESMLSQNISSVASDQNYTVYSFNSFVKFKGSGAIVPPPIEFEKKDHITQVRARRKSISICQNQPQIEEPKTQILPFSLPIRSRRKSITQVERTGSLSRSMLKKHHGLGDSNAVVDSSAILSGSFMKSVSLKGSSDIKSPEASSSNFCRPSLQQSTETFDTPPSVKSRRPSGQSTQQNEDPPEPIGFLKPMIMDQGDVPSSVTLSSRRGSTRSNEMKEGLSIQRRRSDNPSDFPLVINTGSRRTSVELTSPINAPSDIQLPQKMDFKVIKKTSLTNIVESPKIEPNVTSFPFGQEDTIKPLPKPTTQPVKKSRQRSNSELPARDAAMFRRMSMVGPDIEEHSPEETNTINTMTFEQKELEAWHLIHRPPKTIRSMRFPFKKGQFSGSLDPATMFQDLHKSLVLIKENHVFSSLAFSRTPDYYMFECDYNAGNDETAVKFEVEICKVSLLKMHALRIKRIKGDIFDFQKLHKDILGNVNWC